MGIEWSRRGNETGARAVVAEVVRLRGLKDDG